MPNLIFKYTKVIFLLFLLVVLAGTTIFFLYDKSYNVEINQVSPPSDTDWYTVAANPQRTSWVSTEVRNTLKPEWFYRIPFYVSQKVQSIITNNTVYIASSKGLYALNTQGVSFDGTTREANTSTALKWIYCTSTQTKITSGDCGANELPLGNSPTVINGIAYVGGFDKRIHAVDASTGNKVWVSQEAGAGFHANPLVVQVNGQWTVIVGNRDGKIYFYNATNGNLLGTFPTGGPIMQSAAFKVNTQNVPVVYFASNDMHAYFVNAATRQQIRKSSKLPGTGFHSYWPVITTQRDPSDGQIKEYVIFNGLQSFGNVNKEESEDIYCIKRGSTNPPRVTGRLVCEEKPTYTTASCIANTVKCDPANLPTITAADPWGKVGGSIIDALPISDYLKNKPYRREVFIFNTATGAEFTFNNGLYAPLSHAGADQGTRYPPVIGKNANGDDMILSRTSYKEGDIPKGGIVAWKFGTTLISELQGVQAIDEPTSYAIGDDGNTANGTGVMYERLMGERHATAFTFSATPVSTWNYHNQGGTGFLSFKLQKLYKVGWPYAYFKHGDVAPMIPFQGKVYAIANNALVAFSTDGINSPATAPDLGKNTGTVLSALQKSTIVSTALSKVTADTVSWPEILQQETYFELGIRYFKALTVAGASTPPAQLTTSTSGPTTVLTSSYGGETLTTKANTRVPTILFNNTGSQYILQGTIKGVAYRTTSNTTQVQTDTASFTGNQMGENWLLIWEETDNHRWFPLDISLEKKPGQVTFNAGAIDLTFSGGAGRMSVIPLYGMYDPLPGKGPVYASNDRYNDEVKEWNLGNLQSKHGVNIVTRARDLAHIAQAFPVDWTETITVQANKDATISTSYTAYDEFTNAWGKSPRRIAYLSPVHALAIHQNGQINLANKFEFTPPYVLPLGVMAGVNGSTATLTLPVLSKYWKDALSVPPAPTTGDPLQVRLETELQKFDADANGTWDHLRPGFIQNGQVGSISNGDGTEWVFDYFHNPADNLALPS